MSLNHVSATGSWKNNYTVLTASFDKDDMSGSFAYTWQAGDNDRAARILLVDVDPVSGELQNAKGFYGYGNQVQTTLATASTDKSAAITGFYCNWAGPGNGNAADFAQYQAMSYNSTKGVFEATSSDITYAPVNSCYYEGTPAGFQYDVDADGTLETDTALLYVYQSSSSTGYTSGAKVLDLMIKGTSTDLMGAIQAKGYTSPTYPAP